MANSGPRSPGEIDNSEHIDPLTTGDNISAKRAALYVWDGANWVRMAQPGGSGGGGTSSNFGATFPASGTAAGASDGTDMQPLLVDGSGNLKVNVVTGGGGGTQYTDGGTPPANPVGNTIEWSDGSHWQTVSTAKPLPVTATFSPSGTQDVNLKQVGGSTISIGQQLAAASLPVILPAATITTLTPPAAITNYANETGGNLAAAKLDLDSIVTNTTVPTTVRYGQSTVSVTNTAVQLNNQVCVAVVVQALAGNAGNVVIGDSSVTTGNGFQLQPGQATGIAISNVNKLYVNGTSGDGVCWIGS